MSSFGFIKVISGRKKEKGARRSTRRLLPWHDGGSEYMEGTTDEFGMVIDAGRITTQLGTPRGRYDEHSSKYFPQ
jgi:hypothetical protein